MSELDEFLSSTINSQVKAEEAIQNGDPLPRLEMWSKRIQLPCLEHEALLNADQKR